MKKTVKKHVFSRHSMDMCVLEFWQLIKRERPALPETCEFHSASGRCAVRCAAGWRSATSTRWRPPPPEGSPVCCSCGGGRCTSSSTASSSSSSSPSVYSAPRTGTSLPTPRSGECLSFVPYSVIFGPDNATPSCLFILGRLLVPK